MKIKEVINALEQFAPLPLQESYDNAGLQIGLTDVDVSGVLLCLDVTEPIVDEAVYKGCNLIVAHHPLIFHKLAHITTETYVQRTIIKAIQNGITVVAMHTNMDTVWGGVNNKIAEKLHLTNLRTFGKTKQVANNINGKITYASDGIIGDFPVPLAADDFIILLKKCFKVECLQANQLLRRNIKTIALCGGSGAFLIKDAVEAGVDAFVTGEISYHDFFCYEQTIQLCAIGHYQSEQFTVEIFKAIIERDCSKVKCYLSNINTNPIIYL